MKTLNGTCCDPKMLCAGIWQSLYQARSSDELFASWAAALRESVDAMEVGIWAVETKGAGAVLKAYACQPGFGGDSLTKNAVVEAAIRDASAGKVFSPIFCTAQEGSLNGASTVGDESELPSTAVISIESDGRKLGVVAINGFEEGELWLHSAGAKVADDLGAALIAYRRSEQLRRSQRTHETLVYGAPVGICGLDREGKLTLWNPKAEQLFGWRASEVLGRPLPITRSSERDLLDICCRGALAGQSTKKIELKCVTRSGADLAIALSTSPLFDESGDLEGALVVAVDISDRKQVEARFQLQANVTQALVQSDSFEEAARSVLSLLCEFNNWACGEYWTAERDGRDLARLVTARPRSMSAERFDSAIRSRDVSAVDDLVRNVLNAAEPIWFPEFSSDRAIDRATLAAQCGLRDAIGFRVVHANETLGVMLFCAEQIDRPDPQLMQYLRTIGEQIGTFARQQQLAASLQAADEKALHLQKLETMWCLLGSFVHDFNNLMTIILGYGDLLLDNKIDEGLARQAHREIFDAAQQASQMARRLLTVSRKECFEPIALNVNSVIERLQSMIRRVIGREIELHLELAPHIGQFNANPGEIEQLVMNLVINARDAMESGGRLTISTRDVEFDRSQALPSSSVRPGRYVALQVSDTGCGMDDVVKQQIFEPFFTTKAADKGTGIGLSTVRDIVSRCHGHIRVQSHAGQGATFELLFPSAANGLECWVVESEPQPVSSGTETVLLVDDEPAVRRLISLVLKARGYAVIESESPADAIALCKKSAGKVDLLITDLIMPGMNGLELATNILNDRPNLKVLSISAYSDVGSPSKGFQLQDWPFLQKPFTSHELATKVRQALDAQV